MEVRFFDDPVTHEVTGDSIERLAIQFFISDTMRPVRVATDEDKEQFPVAYKAYLDAKA